MNSYCASLRALWNCGLDAGESQISVARMSACANKCIYAQCRALDFSLSMQPRRGTAQRADGHRDNKRIRIESERDKSSFKPTITPEDEYSVRAALSALGGDFDCHQSEAKTCMSVTNPAISEPTRSLAKLTEPIILKGLVACE